MPRVSILLPTYNGALTLERAVQSVRSQSFEDWELFILDDGSTDMTPALAARMNVEDPRVIYAPAEENSGIQKTLNRGLRSAGGEFVARLDDDDAWIDPRKLEAQIEYMDLHPDCFLLGTGAIVMDEFGKELYRIQGPGSDGEIRERILMKNCFVHSAVVFRKEAVLELGGYGESQDVRHVEDYDLWLRLGRRGTFANLKECMVRFTLRPGNISSRNKTVQFRRDISLVWSHRAHYPGFLKGFSVAVMRYAGYAVFRLLPAGIEKSILARYKNF
jgi:glycosyltransferase involved in cell wall biosynthesis